MIFFKEINIVTGCQILSAQPVMNYTKIKKRKANNICEPMNAF
jgi:hypothetical protein